MVVIVMDLVVQMLIPKLSQELVDLVDAEIWRFRIND